MRTNIIASVVNNVVANRIDSANVVVAAVVRSHCTHSTRLYCTRASELAGGKSVLAAGQKPAFPNAMPSSTRSEQASRGLWCSQRHLGSLASINS